MLELSDLVLVLCAEEPPSRGGHGYYDHSTMHPQHTSPRPPLPKSLRYPTHLLHL